MLSDDRTLLSYPTLSKVYNSAITLCARGKQRKRAAALLKEMVANGLVPNAVTFSATIAASCGQEGDWRGAMQILADARGGNSDRYVAGHHLIFPHTLHLEEYVALKVRAEARA